MTTPRIMQRLAELARVSAMGDAGIERLYLTPEHKKALELVGVWMKEAGLTVSVDAAGNLRGTMTGTDPSLPAILLGSHLDSVVDAGAYDGCLGVVSAIEAMDALNKKGVKLRHTVTVIGFADEEGVRFGSTYLGSRAIAGGWPEDFYTRPDAEGISAADALTAFGLDPARIPEALMKPEDCAAYFELHIEQGPCLQNENLAMGLVTGISAARRLTYTFEGMTGHAGTVPMTDRRDAGLAAARFMLTAEEKGKAFGKGVVVTTGHIEFKPNVTNCINGKACVNLDVRAPDDATRDAVFDAIDAAAAPEAALRGVTVTREEFYRAPAVHCDAKLMELTGAAVTKHCGRIYSMSSGAGHDAAAMAAIAPFSMIFVRCKDGISHNPAESIRNDDAELCIAVLEDLITDADGKLA